MPLEHYGLFIPIRTHYAILGSLVLPGRFSLYEGDFPKYVVFPLFSPSTYKVAMNAWPLKICDYHTIFRVDSTHLNQTSLIQFKISRVNKDFLFKKKKLQWVPNVSTSSLHHYHEQFVVLCVGHTLLI